MHSGASIATLFGLVALAASRGIDASERLSDRTLGAEEPEGNVRASKGHRLHRAQWRRKAGRVTIKVMTEASLGALGKSQAEIAEVHAKGKSAYAKEKIVFKDPSLGIDVVDVGAGNEESFIDKLTQGPNKDVYEYVEVDYLHSPVGTVPNDPYVQSRAWHHTAMRSFDAWDLHTGTSAVTVAICDTGVQTNHPDLKDNKADGYNILTDRMESDGGDVGPVGGNRHGTWCAGCAAAVGNNGAGIAGVGWNIRHRPIVVTDQANGDSFSSVLAACATWACDRGDVVSVSYSGAEDKSRRDAARHCKRQGSLMFNAAGNSQREMSSRDADNDDLIVVGATDRNDRKSSFSNYGSYVDIVAPGTSVYTTTTEGGYKYVSGTSFSAPLAAGLAALIWSANPKLSPDEVEQVIKESATDLGDSDYDPFFAHGRINSYEALRHPRVGLVGPPPPPTGSPPPPTPNPTNRPPSGGSCMSGEARVEEAGLVGEAQFKYVKDLTTGDTIKGLDENMDEKTCSVVAVGDFGVGPVFGNYTEDHFNLDAAGKFVAAHGRSGDRETVNKYAVLTSCPVGLDETGVGFTPVDADFLGDGPLSWSDYVLIHQSILNIVRQVGPFVFSPSTYTSIKKVKRYTKRFYKTMLKCAKDSHKCHAFERAAEDLLENSVTHEAKAKVRSRFYKLGKPKSKGSISAAVSNGGNAKP